jgi:hypothetical protein
LSRLIAFGVGKYSISFTTLKLFHFSRDGWGNGMGLLLTPDKILVLTLMSLLTRKV